MAQSSRSLSLRILSPAVELADGMDMAHVAIDTSIGALKLKLMELLPSHPTPDRMRLIYYGRLLADDSETLAHLFGHAALTQTTPFTLHLVVRALCTANDTSAASNGTAATPNVTAATPNVTAASRRPLFPSWPAPVPATDAPNPQPNMLPPGATQHPLMPPGAAFVPQGATATPPHPAAPTPTLHHSREPSPTLLQQLMDRQQHQMRQPMPTSTPPHSAPQTPPPFAHPHPQPHPHPHLHFGLHPNAHQHQYQHPHPQAPNTHQHPHTHQLPQTHQHPHAHPPQQPQPHTHRHATITINQSTIAVPMPLGPNGFPNMHHLFHQPAQPQIQQFNPSSPTVYLLSSPTGPHALLFSPQGTYTASLPLSPVLGMPAFANPLFAHAPPHTPAVQAQPPAAFNPPPAVIDPQQAPEQIVQQVNQGAPENQDFNALAPWQPLLAQAWMLLRLLFFAWIFLGTDQGWRRPLALLAIGLVFWAINAGGIGNTLRDAVRSWWQAVIDLPGQPQVQEHGMIRQALRPAERLLALLIASLWPGVGERTVTARREAEERQRREEGERQQAEAERQRQLEPDQSARPQDSTSTDESAPITAIADQSTVTATGTEVSVEGQELRERKTPTHESSSSADQPSSTAEPAALSREEQRAQQVSNLAADW